MEGADKLNQLTIQQLKAVCTEMNIEVPQNRSVRKSEYITMIENASLQTPQTADLEEIEIECEQIFLDPQDYADEAPASSFFTSQIQPSQTAQPPQQTIQFDDYITHQHIKKDPDPIPPQIPDSPPASTNIQPSIPAPTLKIPTPSPAKLHQPNADEVFAAMMKAKFDKEPPKFTHKPQKDYINYYIILEVVFAITISLLALGLIFGCGFVFYDRFIKPTVFWDNGKISENGCKPCPSNGYWSNGVLTCDLQFIRDRDSCVENKELDREATALLNKLEQIAVERSVKQVCEDPQANTTVAISEAGLFSGIHITESKDKVMKRLTEKLTEGVSNILIIEGQPSNLQVKVSNPPLPLLCQLELAFYENLGTIIWVWTGTSFILHKVLGCRRRWKIRGQAKEIYEGICVQLRANVDDTPYHGMSEKDIQSLIQATTGRWSFSDFWNAIQDLKNKDENVKVFENIHKGRPVMFWQWIGAVPKTSYRIGFN